MEAAERFENLLDEYGVEHTRGCRATTGAELGEACDCGRDADVEALRALITAPGAPSMSAGDGTLPPSPRRGPMADIDRGVRVVVRMTSNTLFPWQDGCPSFEATFLHAPAGPGDSYAVRLDDGREVRLNGNSAEFIGIYPTPTPEPQGGQDG